jgi:hypothetical protein
MKHVNLEPIAELVKQTRRDAAWIAEGMPNHPRTDGQIRLMDKHGTPKTFAEGCIAAIGEISILEAQQAAEKYKREWEAA